MAFADGPKDADAGPSLGLASQPNLRDLGGYAAADGNHIKKGMLFRSGDLSGLSDADLKVLEAHGIAHDVDLRSDFEVAASADRVPAGARYHNLPLIRGSVDLKAFLADVLSGKLDARASMIEGSSHPEDFALESWRQLFGLLAEGRPVLWHCTAGKDRAGMTTALVLSALGVERDMIIQDYLKTNRFLAAQKEATIAGLNKKGTPGERLRPILGVEREYIEAWFKGVEREWGSVQVLLTDVLGADIGALRAHYLE
jgi:protein-tyrosine phosphatase